MTKYTIKQLKGAVKNEVAFDITNISEFNLNQLTNTEKGFEKIGISFGKYGMNGALLRGCKTGRLFVITARNSTLFRLV